MRHFDMPNKLLPTTDTREFNGVRFYRYPDAKQRGRRCYFWPSTHNYRKGVGLLHQEIWKSVNGKIPIGMEIHHKDENPLNNEIKNLERLTRAQHNKIHFKKRNEIYQSWRNEKFGNSRLPVSQPRGTVEAKCSHCGISIKKQNNNRTERNFCSESCFTSWHWHSGLHHEKRICQYCKKEFSTHKSSKSKFCSLSCANYFR